MKINLQIVFFASLGLFVRASTDNDLFDEKLAAVHSTLSADIADVKGDIHIKILPEIERLKQRECQCPMITKADDKAEAPRDRYDVQDIEQMITTVMKAFMNEKTERKSVSSAVHELKATLETKLRDLSLLVSNNENTLNANKIITDRHTEEIGEMETKTSDILDRTAVLSEKFNNVSDRLENMCSKSKTGLKHPSFVSEWFVMKSQNESLCERTVEHKLGKYPAKVDVQIKPLTGTNEEMIFVGDTEIQSDDDTNSLYGGVVYFYNQKYVILRTPKKNNNNDIGILMTACGLDARYKNMEGDSYLFSEALVRVRVWSIDDFPEAAFTTNWLPLDVTDESLSFKELSHGLSDYPAFVSVQIKSSNGMISEGMGAVMTSPKAWSNAGGVIYAFDDKSIRIWSSYMSDVRSEYSYGRLLGTVDGWGLTNIPADLKGSVKVTVWSAQAFTDGKDFYEYSGNVDDGIIDGSNKVNFDIDNDLISLSVQALDGDNRGFLFKGFGASQSQNIPYGGAIYAYNKDGQVKIWRPKLGNNGYLVHINQPYGNGKLNQASNNAAYRVTLLKGVE